LFAYSAVSHVDGVRGDNGDASSNGTWRRFDGFGVTRDLSLGIAKDSMLFAVIYA
jgi:hypothetical protein